MDLEDINSATIGDISQKYVDTKFQMLLTTHPNLKTTLSKCQAQNY